MDRKGLFTPDQEKKLDRLIKFNNPILESLDGPAINLIDNEGLDRLIVKLKEKNPDLWPIFQQVIDVILAAIPEDVSVESQPNDPGQKPPDEED